MIDDPKIARSVEAYERLGNIHKVAKEIGLSAQTICNHLEKAGIDRKNQKLSDAEIARIKNYYETISVDDFDLDALSAELGRTKHLICKYACRLGLTDISRKLSAKNRQGQSERSKLAIQRNGHPRGALGLKHSEQTRKILGEKSKISWAIAKATGTGQASKENRIKKSIRMSEWRALEPGDRQYTRGKGGIRPDLPDIWFRSSWEANYARYLNKLVDCGVVDKWEFERHLFKFSNASLGVRSYRPDFAVYYKGETKPVFIEVKGWKRDSDNIKWQLMAQEFPDVEMLVVDAPKYSVISSYHRQSIGHWE